MELKWREGMNGEVKGQVIKMLTTLIRPEFKLEHFQYLKHSQFYKICVVKHGSRSPNIEKAFVNQQEFYQSVLLPKLLEMRVCLSKFVFGFTNSSLFEANKEDLILSIPSDAETFQSFKSNVDALIYQAALDNLKHLWENSSTRLMEIKQQIVQLSQIQCKDEETFNSNSRKWSYLIASAININCLYQILTEIQATHNNITDFKNNLSKKVVALHGNKMLSNLYKYSLEHRETDND